MVSKRRSNTIASIGTAIVLLIVFLLLWFISIHSMREPEDEGIEVAFGVTEEGGGYQSQPSEQQPAAAQTPATSAQQPSSNELMTQEDEEALALQRQREQEMKERQQAEAERLQREREAHEKAEAEQRAREQALAEQRAKEQAAIDKANQFGSLFGHNSSGSGSGETTGDSHRGNSDVGHGSTGSTSWSLAGRSCKALPAPSNNFTQEGKVVVAIIVDGSGKVVSAKATEGTTISNDATIQLALKAAYKAEFSFTDRPDKQFGTITYIFKFK